MFKSSIPLFIGLRYVGARQKNLLVAFLSRVSMMGLIVGVGLLIVVLSIMNGFDRELRERILSLLPQASVYHRQGIEDWQSLQVRLEQHSKILAAAPFIEVQALVGATNKAEPVALFGIEPVVESRVSELTEYLSEDAIDHLITRRGIVLGAGIASKIGVISGDEVMVVVPNVANPRSPPQVTYAPVVAVLTTQTEVDTKLALMHLAVAQQFVDGGRISGMRLKLEDLFEAHDVLWEVIMDLGRGYYGNSWLSTHGNLYHAIQVSKRLVGLLMSLIVAIAAFNVVSTLIMVVVEKQGAIAILRTLGASSSAIMGIFVVQGLVIGVIGALLGVVFGVALSLVAGSLMTALENILGMGFMRSDVYPLTYLPSQLIWQDIAQVAGTAIGLCLVAALYPAWRASRVDPAETLRYE